MSRPESPLKGNQPDEDMVKKLKALLLKEKRINKENVKLINDLKVDAEKKSVENELLIGQIQRLSENIGDLDFSENNKSKELSDLKARIVELQHENERLLVNGADKFMKKLRSSIKQFNEENSDILLKKFELIESDDLHIFGNQISDVFTRVNEVLQSYKDVRNVLQDGLDKMTLKCNHLETVIASKEDDFQKHLRNNSNELEQKEEQIKRLEMLIEDNRNISRALETERDQLQNDLVDLRQRHEEKEGYLIEEYREAQQSLENYRIFTDKQSAEKTNEMERLRKCLIDFQQDIANEPLMSDCRLCRDVDSLFDKLKIELNIDVDNYEDIVTIILDKHMSFTNHIQQLEQNDYQCHKELDMLSRKVEFIEKSMFDKVFEKSQNITTLNDSMKQSLSENEEMVLSLQDELKLMHIFKKNMEDLTQLRDSSDIIENIRKLISTNQQLANEIAGWEFNQSELKNRYEQLIQDKDSYIKEMTDKLTEVNACVVDNDLMKHILSEKEEMVINLQDELKQMALFKENLMDLTQLRDSSDIIESIKTLSSTNHQLTNEISVWEFNQSELKNRYEQLIQDKETYITELTDKLSDMRACVGDNYSMSRLNNKVMDTDVLLTNNVTNSAVNDANNIDVLKQSISDKVEIINDLTNTLSEKEEKIYSLNDELKQFKLLNRSIEEILQLDDSSMIIESINNSISLNNQLTNEVQVCNTKYDQLKSHYEERLRQKESDIVNLTTKLAEAGKQLNHNDLMNLEMAEIDKTLVNLNNQMMSKSAKITELELTLKSQEDIITEMRSEIDNMGKQNQHLDERNNKMKQMLVKTKRELTDCKNQATLLQEKENLHLNEVELLNANLEDTKVLLSEAIAERERTQERYNLYAKKMDSITKNKDITISSLRSRLETIGNNHKSLQQEFDLYKVKVQTAFNTKLRSSSTFSDFMTLPTNDTSNNDDVNIKTLTKQITDLEMNIDDLKIDLREKDENILTLKSDLDLLRWDNDKLSEKITQVTKENNELTINMQQLTEQLQNDSKRQEISHSDTLERFHIEKEKLTAMYQNQIESLRSNYENEIENLTLKIDEKEMEKVKIQEEIWDCREQLKTADQKLGQIRTLRNEQHRSSVNDIWTQQLKSPLGQERQQGEGMEMNNEPENIISLSHNKIASPKQFAKSATHNNAFISLDQLLNSHNSDDQQLNEEIITTLKAEMSSYRRKNEHLTELLNETEATVTHLTEQAMLLKTEIRRLENNEERDHTLQDRASKEYLKNVIIKFLHHDTKSDERQQLVPVLVTLLSLDNNEKVLLTTFCQRCQYTKKDGEGWTSYLSWTGIS